MPKPENLVEKNKRISKLVAKGETDRIVTLREEMGIIPWEGKKLTEDEKQELFEKIVVDETAVKEVVDRERQIWHLSPDRNPIRLRKLVQKRYDIAIKAGRFSPSDIAPPTPAIPPAPTPPAIAPEVPDVL